MVPDNIAKINKQKKIRIFKLLGLLCTIIVFNWKLLNLNLNDLVFFALYLISFFVLSYNLIVAFLSVKPWYEYVITCFFIIRNSEEFNILIATIFQIFFSTLKFLIFFTISIGAIHTLIIFKL